MMNHRAIRLTACASLLAITGAACAPGDEIQSAADAPESSATEKGSSTPDAPPGGPIITLKLIAFTPTTVSVGANDTVVWRQDDVATHTVTSGRVEQTGGTATAKPDGRFDSGNLSKGQTFQFSFAEPGEYPFFCAIHPATMTGTVTVT
jgi:plastocyanin